MNNVFPLPTQSTKGRLLPPFLVDAEPRTHAVQFYDDEVRLSETVGAFLSAGLRQGDHLVMIATARHAEAFLAEMDAMDLQRARSEHRVAVYDAHEVLSRFLIDGAIDARRFEEVVQEVLPREACGPRRTRVRAYGEMVDILWGRGQANAALELEELWCHACDKHAIALLCAYQLDHFHDESTSAGFLDVCRSHSHVLPASQMARLDVPAEQLREVAILQQHARRLPKELERRSKAEAELRDVTHENGVLESALIASAKREHEATSRVDASDTFKEMFLDILGHDLRNPLNTILTTTRLMAMRGELAPESSQRLDRVIASGVRMERMIQQLLDIARARLADGIPLERERAQKLMPLVTKVVEEARLRVPGQTIEFEGTDCTAPVDADRFEQVVGNLIGNALDHGDVDRPVRVTVSPRGSHVSIAVHNWGPPIPAVTLSALFDPFRRGGPRYQSLQGLGLGLYISDHIVRAHGGIVEVRSTLETGTTFEAIFPRA